MRVRKGFGADVNQIATAIQNATDSASSGDYATAIQYCSAATTAAVNAEQSLTAQPSLGDIQGFDSTTQNLVSSGASDAGSYAVAQAAANGAQASFLTDNALPANNGGGGGGGGGLPAATSLQQAAQDASDAMGASNGCATVGSSGSAANSAVHAFKTTWNASGQGGALAYNGQYDAACSAAIAQVLGSAPAPCGAQPAPPGPPAPPAPPAPLAATGMPTWLKWLLGLIVVGGVASLGYWAFFTPQGKRATGMGASERKKRRRGKRRK